MPIEYSNTGYTVTVPSLSDVADVTKAFQDYHDDVSTHLDGKAPKASPAFTGTATFENITLPSNSVTTGTIADGAITNADINASAAIAYSKLNLSGSIRSSDILDGTIVDADISPSASIAQTKIAGLGAALSDINTAIGTKASTSDLNSLSTTVNNLSTSVTVLKNTVDYSASTATSYTLGLADAGKMIGINNASAITVTIPTNASVSIPVNTRVDILQVGAGQISFSPASGVTLNSKGTRRKITGQYSAATVIKTDTNTWVLIGDIAA
jgi:hypothetical protein